ncbi:MAG TPA: hypothetical protein VI873_04405 [Candidatus Peribacteraceae bacterium]|nr:hypothetical protein [Candidatus Peribacteraceae bacterium]
MSDSYLDHLPSKEREKIRKRMHLSAEAYEALREKVKGPEDLEKEMKRNEQIAELRFALESEKHFQESSREKIQSGLENAFEYPLTPEQTQKIEAGKFHLTVATHPATHADALVAIPEGKIQEKLPIKTSMTEQFLSLLPAAGTHLR